MEAMTSDRPRYYKIEWWSGVLVYLAYCASSHCVVLFIVAVIVLWLLSLKCIVYCSCHCVMVVAFEMYCLL